MPGNSKKWSDPSVSWDSGVDSNPEGDPHRQDRESESSTGHPGTSKVT